jgi:hypothetical protein
MADDHAKAYGIGYRKPPWHSRFRKCQSGNPRAGPCGALNSGEQAAASPYEKGHSQERGSARRMRKIDVALTQQIKAAAGDGLALKLLMTLLGRVRCRALALPTNRGAYWRGR